MEKLTPIYVGQSLTRARVRTLQIAHEMEHTIQCVIGDGTT